VCTPNETQLERTQIDVGQFLGMLRFEQRGKLEALPGVL
jgi:hypothetical protein